MEVVFKDTNFVAIRDVRKGYAFKANGKPYMMLNSENGGAAVNLCTGDVVSTRELPKMVEAIKAYVIIE